MSRQEVFARLRQNPECSVLIVGAGINGIGTFRDLALQGIDVLMVDRGDFCGGASAASSHMLHGGIRYLEYGEFRLVREALTERNRLLQNAPHYAKPMPTTIPIFHWFSGVLNAPLKFLNLRDKPSERGAFIIKIGLMLYDFFTRGQQTLPAHRLHSREASLDFRPSINHDIVCTATYYDAWMPYPERIALELILDAEAENSQARALNYVSLDSAKGSIVTLRDELTGETVAVKPRIVINAAGPWIDLANLSMGKQTQFIGGTKGSHIIVDHPELREACQGHEMFFENKDGRICLMFPLLDKVIIGTTDIRVDDPEKAECTEDEVEYMIDLVSYVFPTIKVERSQIVFWFCGVRPLPHSSASRTGAISRDHSIRGIEPNGSALNFPVLSLVSGKWTTYRAFAEQVTDQVLQRLQKPRVADTKKLAIGGGRDYPRAEADQQKWIEAVQSKTGVPAERIEQLFERYGTRAADIAAFIAAGSDQPFRAAPSFSHREVIFLAQREKIVHLDDFLLRRSLIAMLGLTTGDLIEEMAAVLAPVLGWSDELVSEEIERAAHILTSRYGVPSDRVQVLRKELA